MFSEEKIIKPLKLHKKDYVKLYKLPNNKQAILCVGKSAQVIIDLNTHNLSTISTIQLNPHLEEKFINKSIEGLNYTILKDINNSKRISNGHLLAENDLYELLLNQNGNIVSYNKTTRDLDVVQVLWDTIYYPVNQIKEEPPYIIGEPTYKLADKTLCKNNKCDKLFNYRLKDFGVIEDTDNEVIGVRFKDGYTIAFVKDEEGDLTHLLAEEDYYNLTPSGRIKFNRVKYTEPSYALSSKDTYHKVGIQVGIGYENLDKEEEYFFANDKTLYLRKGGEEDYKWYKIKKG